MSCVKLPGHCFLVLSEQLLISSVRTRTRRTMSDTCAHTGPTDRLCTLLSSAFAFFFASSSLPFFFFIQRLPIHIRRLKRASSTVFLFRFVIRFFSSILISRGTGSFERSFQSRCLKNTWNIINIDVITNRAF